MGRGLAIPDPAAVTDDTPLRLEVAAAIAYPDGSMTVSGLRREAARGRLAIERTAGKDYTTLAYIKDMRTKCLEKAKAPASGSDQSDETTPTPSRTGPSGSSATADTRRARDAASTILGELKKPSRATSPGSTSDKRRRGNVIPLKSRSPTS